MATLGSGVAVTSLSHPFSCHLQQKPPGLTRVHSNQGLKVKPEMQSFLNQLVG
jgi:hypothetical protein